MQPVDLQTVGLLLLVACFVAIMARRFGFPYAVALVAAGVALNIAGYRSRVEFTPELTFTVFLPPLIFEASLHLNWKDFRREAPLILNLAFVGTLLSAGVVAVGMHWFVGWSWQAAFLLGALTAATDPVSVLAMMKEQRAERRLRFIMEAESIVNDGTAAVLFATGVAAIAGRGTSPVELGAFLSITVLGGVGCGLAITTALLLLAGSTKDHLVELTLSVLAAYGSFAIAQELGVSGVLAALAAGMTVGNWGRGRVLTQRGGDSVIRFWDFAVFLVNSLIFILIGGRAAEQPFATYLYPAVVGTVLALAGRAAAIYPLAPLYARSRLAISKTVRHLLFWGGLRGALALALAMGAPQSLPEHDALVGAAFAVVTFSIFVQGLTVPHLLRRSGMLAGEG